MRGVKIEARRFITATIVGVVSTLGLMRLGVPELVAYGIGCGLAGFITSLRKL